MMPQYWDSHGFQFWIHQSVLSSALLAFNKSELFPMTITDQDLASQIVMLFPEFTKKYGQEATSWLTIDLDFTQGELVEFTKENGIDIGMQGGIQVTLGVFANYSTSEGV
jgi:hypothetical protein